MCIRDRGVTGSQSSGDEYETICTPVVDEDGSTIDKDGNKAEWVGWIKNKWNSIFPAGIWHTLLVFWVNYSTYIIIALTVIVLAILQYFKIPNKFVGFVIGLFDRKQSLQDR